MLDTIDHEILAARQEKEFKKASKKLKKPRYYPTDELFRDGYFAPEVPFDQVLNYCTSYVFMSLAKGGLHTAMYQILTWTLGYLRVQKEESRRTIMVDLATIKKRVRDSDPISGLNSKANKDFQLHARADLYALITEVERLVQL